MLLAAAPLLKRTGSCSGRCWHTAVGLIFRDGLVLRAGGSAVLGGRAGAGGQAGGPAHEAAGIQLPRRGGGVPARSLERNANMALLVPRTFCARLREAAGR